VGTPGAVEVGGSPVDRAVDNLVDTAEEDTGNVVGVVGEEGTLDMHDTAAGTVGTVGEEDTVDMGSRVQPCTERGTVGGLPQGIAGIVGGIGGLVSCSSLEEEVVLAEACLRRLSWPGCMAGWWQCCTHPLPPVAVAAQAPPGCSSAEPSHGQTSFSLHPFLTLVNVCLEFQSAIEIHKRPQHSSSLSSLTLLSRLLPHLW